MSALLGRGTIAGMVTGAASLLEPARRDRARAVGDLARRQQLYSYDEGGGLRKLELKHRLDRLIGATGREHSTQGDVAGAGDQKIRTTTPSPNCPIVSSVALVCRCPDGRNSTMAQRDSYKFTDSFLHNAQRQFHRRARSLARQGELHIWGQVGDVDGDMLEVSVKTWARRSAALRMRHGNKIDVFVRSAASSDRGRILLRLENLRVPGNAEALVSTFEATISLVRDDEEEWRVNCDRIWQLWKILSFRVMP